MKERIESEYDLEFKVSLVETVDDLGEIILDIHELVADRGGVLYISGDQVFTDELLN